MQVMRSVRDLIAALSLAVQAQMSTGNQIHQDIEKWLSPADPFINFNTANDAHYEGTAEWFTQSSVFRSWKESGSLLWIHGKRISSSSLTASSADRTPYLQRDLGNLSLGMLFIKFYFCADS
jgi:hypothetical protein